MRRIEIDERRARLARRHGLSPGSRAANPVEAAAAVVALHSTDPATVHLSIAARTAAAAVSPAETALYDDRTLLRLLGMRRTMWVVPTPFAAIVQSGCATDIEARERRSLIQVIEKGGLAADGAAWLAAVEAETLAALDARGEAYTAKLRDAVPGLQERLVFGGDSKWAVELNLSSRVLFVLAARGAIVRGRPRGTWTSSQYRWAPMESWRRGPVEPAPARADARVDLARSWLAAFGPATLVDLNWWTGWTMGETRRAVAALPVAEVDLGDGATGVVLAHDVDPEPAVGPWVAFLPALDPTSMGWKHRGWYVGDHTEALFDRSGNIGPTVWSDGRIVGGWAQRPDGSVVHRLLEDVGAAVRDACAAQESRLEQWLAGVRVTPRFPTPLQKELASL